MSDQELLQSCEVHFFGAVEPVPYSADDDDDDGDIDGMDNDQDDPEEEEEMKN